MCYLHEAFCVSKRISCLSLELYLLWLMSYGLGKWGVTTLSRMVLGVGAESEGDGVIGQERKLFFCVSICLALNIRFGPCFYHLL